MQRASTYYEYLKEHKPWPNMPSSSVMAGTVAGSFMAAAFNPWDRALYLSVKEKRPFRHRENFRHPFHGFEQALVQRVISGGLYFILQDETTRLLQQPLQKLQCSEHTISFAIGSVAGFFNGALVVLCNQIATVKYHAWGKEGARFLDTARHMYREGGLRPFYKGSLVTAARDTVFGSVYEVLRLALMRATSPVPPALLLPPRHAVPPVPDNTTAMGFFPFSSSVFSLTLADGSPRFTYKQREFACNLISASAATVASSPLNFVRSMKYATPANLRPPSSLEALTALRRESKIQTAFPGRLGRAQYLQQRLSIGWGTARVGVGMAAGQHVYGWTKTLLTHEAHPDPDAAAVAKHGSPSTLAVPPPLKPVKRLE